jgi:DNA-binding ferritin-like protein (Dps family)
MPEHIGGALADIDAVFADLGRAQSASDLHGGNVATDVATALGEVDDVSRALQGAVAERARMLQEEISRAAATLQAADWAGGSRAAAEAAEAQLSGDVRNTVEAARAGLESLSAALGDQVQAFHDEVSGEFSVVMGNIRDAYAELARGTQLFAENLAQADQTISFTG